MSTAERIKLICLECGKRFAKRLGPKSSLDVECPRCHGVDVDVA